MTRDSRYRLNVNFRGPIPQEQFTADQQRDLDLHDARIGPPLRWKRGQGEGDLPQIETLDGKMIDPQNISARISAHFNQIKPRAQRIYKGLKVMEVLEGMYSAVVFGVNAYVEGSSGTGKTSLMRFLCQIMQVPLAEFDASADASDLQLLGGEVPRGDNKFSFGLGPLLKPGAVGIMIDELPRLPALTANVLLQAAAERRVTVALPVTGSGDHVVLLSPGFFVLGVGNPVGYGGQGERNVALWDRFGIGLYMPQPLSPERDEMLKSRLIPQPIDLMAPEFEKTQAFFEPIPPSFSFREAHAALYCVNVDEEHRQRMIAACYAISPDAFLRRVDWKTCPYFNAASDELTSRQKTKLKELRKLVNENLAEGSNPRGEEHMLRNARALRLMDNQNNDFEVARKHLSTAFRMANRARLKTFPGCEDQVEPILDLASEVFFDERAEK